MNNYLSDSDSEYENENENDHIIYDPEENSITKYNLVLCERYNELIHGETTENVHSHYLTHVRFKIIDIDTINSFIQISNGSWKLEIAECHYLPSYHFISIIKTFWLKIIQRKWKAIFKERKVCISRRSNPNSLKYRQIYGRWPDDCLNIPTLKGIL
jgi:hypothetical protein